jgi:phage baseplate assembly protein W
MSARTGRINAIDSHDYKRLLGFDIRLAEFVLGADIAINKNGDIDVASEDTNLAQAILHRLRTVKGELSDIGHSNYGSTLYDFVGEPNNEITRARIRAVIRDILLQEPRIKEITNIVVRSHNPAANETARERERMELVSVSEGNFTDDDDHDNGSNKSNNKSDIATFALRPNLADSLNAVDIDITVVPIGRTVPLNIVFPFYLEVM